MWVTIELLIYKEEEHKLRLGASTILLSLALAGLMALPSSASSIQLGINGSADVGTNFIDFGQYGQPGGPAPYNSAPGYGTFQVSLVNPGVFQSAGVTDFEYGQIQSLNEPVGTISPPIKFMTFGTPATNGTGGSNLQLWANMIPAGAVGPFTLTDTPNGAVASFDVVGYIWNTSTMSKVDTFTGTFSATFDGQTVASLFTSLPLDAPFSATFTATVIPTTIPEPATMVLMGAGLLGVGLLSRRKIRKS